MSWPRILVYYLIAIGLAVYLQGEVRRLHPAVQVPVATTLPFLEAVPERIDRLRAEREDLSVEFRKRDGRWVVTEPVGVASPNDIVDAVIESLTSMPPIEVVADTGEHGQYGLNPPLIRVRIEAGGEILSTIAFGQLNPTHTAVYAKKSGKEDIYLLGLNARYYLDLVFENVRRQLASAGVVPSPGLDARGDGGQPLVPSVVESAPTPVAEPTPEPAAKASVPASKPKPVAPAPKPQVPAHKPAHSDKHK